MRNCNNSKITLKEINDFKKSNRSQISSGSGLILVRTSHNNFMWKFRYKKYNQTFFHNIGKYGDNDGYISLNQARIIHENLYNSLANGIDISKIKTNINNINNNNKLNNFVTIKSLAQSYIKKQKNDFSKTTTENYEKSKNSIIKRFLINADTKLYESDYFIHQNLTDGEELKININDFLNTNIKDISALQLTNFLNSIKNKKQIAKVKIFLKFIFELAVADKQLDKNPINNLISTDIKTEKSIRNRNITDDELIELFKLLNNSKNNVLATATKLLFILGVRKNELLEATWGEFDFDNNIWHLPSQRSKNKKSIDIPLSQFAITLLKSMITDNQANENDYVFKSKFKKKRCKVISNATLNLYITKLIKGNEIIKDNIVPHDARRYVRTTLSKILTDYQAEEREFICERVLNHSINITGLNNNILKTYNLNDFFNERQIALNKLCEYYKQLLNLTTFE